MIWVREIDNTEIELCFELDSNTICLWTREQWESELKKSGVKAIAILKGNKIVGICVAHNIIDEVHLNYFSIDKYFRRKGYGSYLMKYLIKYCNKLNIKKILLEVSETNSIAEVFYSKFNFLTVGIRNNYYKDGSHAVLKEKNL